MTALDVFKRYAAATAELRRIQEMIDRREAMATGATARPLTNDGGSRGSGDASMRLLDYCANRDELEDRKRQRIAMRDSDMACCVYLAEVLPPEMGSIMTRRYLEGKRQCDCADAMHYSLSTIRRLQRNAEDMCRRIILTQWDGNHIPVIAILDGDTDMPNEARTLRRDGG